MPRQGRIQQDARISLPRHRMRSVSRASLSHRLRRRWYTYARTEAPGWHRWRKGAPLTRWSSAMVPMANALSGMLRTLLATPLLTKRGLSMPRWDNGHLVGDAGKVGDLLFHAFGYRDGPVAGVYGEPVKKGDDRRGYGSAVLIEGPGMGGEDGLGLAPRKPFCCRSHDAYLRAVEVDDVRLFLSDEEYEGKERADVLEQAHIATEKGEGLYLDVCGPELFDEDAFAAAGDGDVVVFKRCREVEHVALRTSEVGFCNDDKEPLAGRFCHNTFDYSLE